MRAMIASTGRVNGTAIVALWATENFLLVWIGEFVQLRFVNYFVDDHSTKMPTVKVESTVVR